MRANTFKILILLQVFLFSLSSEATSVKHLGIKFKMDAQVKPNSLFARVVSQILNEGEADFDLIHAAVVDQHIQQFSKSKFATPDNLKDLRARVHYRFASVLGGSVEAFESLKPIYEGRLAELQKVSDLAYNDLHSSIVSPLFLKRTQCYSGTILHDLIRRSEGPEKYFSSHPVYIYEAGHVLPGYMAWDGNQWKLTGVETTLGGKAVRDFLPLNDLQAVRIVDANLALHIELLKPVIENLSEVVVRALQLTALEYGFDLVRLEKTVEAPRIALDGVVNPWTKDAIRTNLNSSPFGFGKNSPPSPGADTPRDQVDHIPARKGDGDTYQDIQRIVGEVRLREALTSYSHPVSAGGSDVILVHLVELGLNSESFFSFNGNLFDQFAGYESSYLIALRGPVARELNNRMEALEKALHECETECRVGDDIKIPLDHLDVFIDFALSQVRERKNFAFVKGELVGKDLNPLQIPLDQNNMVTNIYRLGFYFDKALAPGGDISTSSTMYFNGEGSTWRLLNELKTLGGLIGIYPREPRELKFEVPLRMISLPIYSPLFLDDAEDDQTLNRWETET